MAQGGADVATENYLRNVAPAQRAGARMSGMYGGSRQGIAEGLAQSDLNNQILRASTDLFGNAYESAQQRAAAMSGQMAGLDTQRDISNAQIGMQGQIANQDAALRAGQLGLSTAQGLGELRPWPAGHWPRCRLARAAGIVGERRICEPGEPGEPRRGD